MAVSSSTDFTLNRNQIITRALNTIGAIGPAQIIPAEILAYSADMLNMMIKHWESQGIHIWRHEVGNVFMVPGQTQYNLGTGYDKAANSIFRTTISADEAAAQTVLSVTSTSGISTSDQVGIELDDGTMQWTTVSSKSSTTITVAAALTASATSGNQVYTYTTQLTRPLRIESAHRRTKDILDVPLSIFSRKDYLDMPNKTLQGTVNQIYYDPNRDIYGTLSVYPTSSNCTDVIRIDYLRTLSDLDLTTDNADFPQEWLLAIVYNLAVLLCPTHGKDNKLNTLAPMADRYLQEVSSYDHEPTIVNITNDWNPNA